MSGQPSYGMKPQMHPNPVSLSYAMPMPTQQQYHPAKNSNYDELIGYAWQLITSEDSFPYDTAVRAGRDCDGSIIYVGRSFYQGDLLPAKVIPDKDTAYVSYEGDEVEVDEYEILRNGEFIWEFSTNGQVPKGALAIGRTAKGENLYMGRCLHEGSQTPGKVHPSHGCLYFPFDGAEVCVYEYEVLVVK